MIARPIAARALFAACVTCVPAPAAEPLIVSCTRDSEPVVRELAAAFSRPHPETEIIVPPIIGSRGGIRAVLERNGRVVINWN